MEAKWHIKTYPFTKLVRDPKSLHQVSSVQVSRDEGDGRVRYHLFAQCAWDLEEGDLRQIAENIMKAIENK